MLDEAISDIRRSQEAAGRDAPEKRVRSLVKEIDRIIFQLEELNLQGKDRVPARIRERSLELLVQVPAGEPLEVRHRTVALLDVLFEAQDRLFRIADPDRKDEEEIPA